MNDPSSFRDSGDHRDRADRSNVAPDPALPLAMPSARPSTPANPQATASGDADRGAKHPSEATPDDVRPLGSRDDAPDSPSESESASRRYVRKTRLQDLENTLGPRDWQILGFIAQHGFLTSHQVQGFCFDGHASEVSAARSARRVLARLDRDALIRSLPRRHGGLLAGSAPSTWQLAPAGARLLSPGDGDRYRTRMPSLWHLRHCLALADVHLQFRRLARNRGEQIEVAVEHAARRRFDGLGGERVWLKPDLAIRLQGNDQHGPYEDRWFVEVDLGTESLPTLLRKCQAYETYRLSGREQTANGSFPLVLWAMGDQAGHRGQGAGRADTRRQHLAQSLVRSDAYTPGLYRFAPLDDVAEAIGSIESDEGDHSSGDGS